jgi:hypothetical protein
MTDENFDRLRKIRDMFEILTRTFSKFYNPSENLAVDEVIVFFKGRVVFLTVRTKETQAFRHQNFQSV